MRFGKGKQDLQLVISIMFALYRLEEQEKNGVDYNHNINATSPGLCTRKVLNMSLQVYFRLGFVCKMLLECLASLCTILQVFLTLEQENSSTIF